MDLILQNWSHNFRNTVRKRNVFRTFAQSGKRLYSVRFWLQSWLCRPEIKRSRDKRVRLAEWCVLWLCVADCWRWLVAQSFVTLDHLLILTRWLYSKHKYKYKTFFVYFHSIALFFFRFFYSTWRKWSLGAPMSTTGRPKGRPLRSPVRCRSHQRQLDDPVNHQRRFSAPANWTNCARKASTRLSSTWNSRRRGLDSARCRSTICSPKRSIPSLWERPAKASAAARWAHLGPLATSRKTHSERIVVNMQTVRVGPSLDTYTFPELCKPKSNGGWRV